MSSDCCIYWVVSRVNFKAHGLKKTSVAKDTESEVETLKQKYSPTGTRCLGIRAHFRFQSRHEEESAGVFMVSDSCIRETCVVLISPEDERVLLKGPRASGQSSDGILTYCRPRSVSWASNTSFSSVFCGKRAKEDHTRVPCLRASLGRPETTSHHRSEYCIQPFLHAFSLTYQPRTGFWQQCLCLRNTFLPPTSPWIWEEEEEDAGARMPREADTNETPRVCCWRRQPASGLLLRHHLPSTTKIIGKLRVSSSNDTHDSKMISPSRCKATALQHDDERNHCFKSRCRKQRQDCCSSRPARSIGL